MRDFSHDTSADLQVGRRSFFAGGKSVMGKAVLACAVCLAATAAFFYRAGQIGYKDRIPARYWR
jgi:hypothetical protein